MAGISCPAIPAYFSDKKFNSYFPSKSPSCRLPFPKLRLVCLHGAGMEQLVFLNKGNLRKPMPNPLLDYCEANNVQVLSAQLPGRSLRHQEKPLTSAQEVAKEIFDVLKPLLIQSDYINSGNKEQCKIPYALLAHSMGCFCMYELVRLIIRHRVSKARSAPSSTDVIYPQLPVHLFLSCSISPHSPPHMIPWKQSKGMTDVQLKEEARNWNANESVFGPDMWPIYKKLFINDFPLFDEYVMTPFISEDASHLIISNKESVSDAKCSPSTSQSSPRDNAPTEVVPLGVDATCWYATKDNRITSNHMHYWKQLIVNGSSTKFSVNPIDGGNHAFLYDAKHRETWMNEVVEVLKTL